VRSPSLGVATGVVPWVRGGWTGWGVYFHVGDQGCDASQDVAADTDKDSRPLRTTARAPAHFAQPGRRGSSGVRRRVRVVRDAAQRLAGDHLAHGEAVVRQLESRPEISWSATASASSLRQRINALARTQRVAIWLDRRIDPSQELDFASSGDPLDAALKKLAAKLGAGVGYTDSIVYLGPRPASSKFATLTALRIDEAKQLPPPAQKAFLEKRAWQWPDLATPRNLLKNWLARLR